MQWNELFNSEREPSNSQIKKYIGTLLWDDLDSYLQQTHSVKPKLFYSNCAMDKGMWKGWNVKYKKSGKSLCTVYPKQGYFLLLLPIGSNEMSEAEQLMPHCSEYTQNLFKQAVVYHNGRSLAFEVQNEDILRDVKNLITIRANLGIRKTNKK